MDISDGVVQAHRCKQYVGALLNATLKSCHENNEEVAQEFGIIAGHARPTQSQIIARSQMLIEVYTGCYWRTIKSKAHAVILNTRVGFKNPFVAISICITSCNANPKE